MKETVVIAGTVVGGYALLYGLEITWKLLFKAPAALDTERRKESEALRLQIKTLESNRDSAQGHYRQEAQKILAKLSNPAKKVIRHVLEQEQLFEGGEYQVPELTTAEVRLLLQGELVKEPASLIIRRQIRRMPHRTIWWDITPAYRGALRELLHQQGD